MRLWVSLFFSFDLTFCHSDTLPANMTPRRKAVLRPHPLNPLQLKRLRNTLDWHGDCLFTGKKIRAKDPVINGQRKEKRTHEF